MLATVVKVLPRGRVGAIFLSIRTMVGETLLRLDDFH